MIFASCLPCGRYTRKLGPYFLPIDRTGEILYPHYQCVPCGHTEIPFALNPDGFLEPLSTVDVRRFHR